MLEGHSWDLVDAGLQPQGQRAFRHGRQTVPYPVTSFFQTDCIGAVCPAADRLQSMLPPSSAYDGLNLGRVHTMRRVSTMRANGMKAQYMRSSLSKRV